MFFGKDGNLPREISTLILMTTQMDATVKQQAEELLQGFGLSMSLDLFMRYSFLLCDVANIYFRRC